MAYPEGCSPTDKREEAIKFLFNNVANVIINSGPTIIKRYEMVLYLDDNGEAMHATAIITKHEGDIQVRISEQKLDVAELFANSEVGPL